MQHRSTWRTTMFGFTTTLKAITFGQALEAVPGIGLPLATDPGAVRGLVTA